MSVSLYLGCIWVFLAAGLAARPERDWWPAGLGLVAAAPVLALWTGLAHGWVWPVLFLGGFALVFDRPLRAIIGRLIALARSRASAA